MNGSKENKLIYLAGFMGAGKSTIGPILANTLGWDFYDLDKVIEEREGKKIREIFEAKGEKYFRKVETSTLKQFSEKDSCIIALGGGTMADPENLKILKDSGITFYLKASSDSFYKRLKNKRDRPNIKVNEKDNFSRDELVGRIEELLETRKKYYEQADYTINTDSIPVGITVDRISKIIQKEFLM